MQNWSMRRPSFARPSASVSPSRANLAPPRGARVLPAIAWMVALSSASLAQVEAVDLVLIGGKVITLDEAAPQVRGLAIRGDRIVRVGGFSELWPLIGEETEVIDLHGKLAVPGLIEGHAHFLGIGDSAMQLDLMSAKNWGEIIQLVAGAVKRAKPGELIRGRGWHQEKWDRSPADAIDGLPHHRSLSEVSPNNPVVLVHASGHATFANKTAMDMCGITSETPDPEGGELVRDSAGRPIGAFRETASGLLDAARISARQPDLGRLVELAQKECLRKGITSFQDAGVTTRQALALAELAQEGKLDVRLWLMLRDSVNNIEHALKGLPSRSFGDNRLSIGGVKRSIDGALGSHGAWLLQPYADLSESAGLNTVEVSDVEACAALCAKLKLQLCVHAIGDRANREVLDLYERAYALFPQAMNMRWRIEHAQHLHPDDIPRFAELGVVASMQAVHCTSDAPWVIRRLGSERARSGAYMWRALIDSGAVVTNGTDAPVEDVDPLKSFYASVSRRLPDGSQFYPDQCMSRMEALRSYTIQAAYSA
ncbi:MAG: putative amidohydrolase YtcJ, partial [Planctomycetota bacterium]